MSTNDASTPPATMIARDARADDVADAEQRRVDLDRRHGPLEPLERHRRRFLEQLQALARRTS